MRLRMFGATDRGLVRTSNQDAYFCDAEWGIAIVSDGMGGHKGGEKASQLTSDGLRNAFEAKSSINLEDISTHLDEALQLINAEIRKHSRDNESLRGMGATVNYLHFAGGHVAIGHAGDSRTYLIKAFLKPEGRLRYGMWQLTIDHNVESFIERGLLVPGVDVPEGPLTERQKSRLTRGMGVVEDLKADLYYRKIEEGDVYLTCSDGLHGYVSDRDILQALISGPIGKSPERLIKAAMQAGAPDNVTVVVSVASEVSEPLLKCKGPFFEKAPYLAREPSGQISQVLTAEEIIKKWMAFEVSNDAEVCSSMGRWVFLQKRNKLFKAYPEFDKQVVRERLDQIAPDSATSEIPTEARPSRRQAHSIRNSKSHENLKAKSAALQLPSQVTKSLNFKLGVILALVMLGTVAIVVIQLSEALRLLKLPIY